MYALIFGAGKQGRGILAYFCASNNLEPVFIDVNSQLITQMKEEKEYLITLLQEDRQKHIMLPCRNCIDSTDIEEIALYLKGAKIIFTSVPSKQIRQVGECVGDAWMHLYKQKIIIEKNIILSENGSDKLEQFQCGFLSSMSEEEKAIAQSSIGICEALSMSLAIQSKGSEQALAITIQEQMRLFIQKNQMKGDLPKLKAVRYVDNFESLRKQALYTNNTSSAFVSYLAHLMGYETLKDAMKDEVIKGRLSKCYEEINLTLIKDLGISPNDQKEFAQFARKKYENSEDRIDRHAREVLRKLGREERLTGICERAIKNGMLPETISLGIAAALFYRNEQDSESMQLRELCKSLSLQDLLHKVCGISAENPLVQLVKQQIHWLVEHNYLCHNEIVTKLCKD